MRQRLAHPSIEYTERSCNNAKYPEHIARCLVTAGLLAWLEPDRVLDPACGDGSVVIEANRLRPIEMASLGDLSEPETTMLQIQIQAGVLPGQWGVFHGPLDFLLDQSWKYDVIVLTEILEHLEDPDAVLRRAREKGRHLIASSPEMRPGQVDTNGEHLWMFDGEGYEQMLVEAGWRADIKTHLTLRSEYNFGIWVCS